MKATALIKWISLFCLSVICARYLPAQPSLNYEIYVYDLKKGTTIQVTTTNDLLEFKPCWSPNSKKLAHLTAYTDGIDWYNEIWITNIETGISTPLVVNDYVNEPDWSPDGKTIVYNVWYWTICSIPAEGGDVTVLREAACEPQWSPDGSRIVFLDLETWYNKTMNIYDGSETFLGVLGENPTWSPSGNYIAYSSWWGGIGLIKVDESGNPIGDPVQLTTSGCNPSWSNNSKTIVYQDMTPEGYSGIYSIPVEGGTPVKVCGLENGFDNYDPCYSNNGQYIAFAGGIPMIEKSASINNPVNIYSEKKLQVIALGNPSKGSFAFDIQSNSAESISLRIFDASGKIVMNMNGLQPNSILRVGNNLSKGIYVAEFGQGLERKIIRLLKQ